MVVDVNKCRIPLCDHIIQKVKPGGGRYEELESLSSHGGGAI